MNDLSHEKKSQFFLLCNDSEFVSNPDNATCGRDFVINGVNVFVIQHRRQFYAFLNRCPHMGTTLNWQPDRFLDADAELIQCSSHGALFTIETGYCVAGPCQGQSLVALPLKHEDKQIFVRLP